MVIIVQNNKNYPDTFDLILWRLLW